MDEDSVPDLYATRDVDSEMIPSDDTALETMQLKNVNEVNRTQRIDEPKQLLLSAPKEDQKPLHRLFGSTRHLFVRQKATDIPITEETPFLTVTLPVPSSTASERVIVAEAVVNEEKRPLTKKHDSQESVHRVITERRNRDEGLLERVDRFDIFEVVTTNKGNADSSNVQ